MKTVEGEGDPPLNGQDDQSTSLSFHFLTLLSAAPQPEN